MSMSHSDDLISDDLYRQIIIDHYSSPHHHCRLDHPTHTQEGENASCGDHIELDLRVENGVVTDVGFEGGGCSIFTASASILTDLVKGRSVQDAVKIGKAFKARLSKHTDAKAAAAAQAIDLGELEALDGVRDYPVRIKCALLSWETMLQLLQDDEEEEDTEI